MRPVWHRDVEAIITEFFGEVCNGEPRSVWDYRRIMRRLDVRMKLVAGPARDAGPHVRGSVVYVPRVRGRAPRLRRWLAHELAEFSTYYEGIPPFRCPSSTEWDRHLIARLVERKAK
jgi:hypothetical protein